MNERPRYELPRVAMLEAMKAVGDELKKPEPKGLKGDADKLRYDLLPLDALEQVTRVLTHGAEKYSPWNWAQGFAWSRLTAASLRHIFAFMRGQDLDPETGISHLAHAICCLAFLLSHTIQEAGSDDRHRS